MLCKILEQMTFIALITSARRAIVLAVTHDYYNGLVRTEASTPE